jgi:hypothetical protein
METVKEPDPDRGQSRKKAVRPKGGCLTVQSIPFFLNETGCGNEADR